MSRSGGRLAWFATENGRKFTFGCASTAGIGWIFANYLPNTFLLQQYKGIVQMYSAGTEVPLSETVRKRFDAVMDDLKLNELERSLIRPFTVCGFDMFHAGVSYSKTGAIIGIPINFTYTSPETIDHSQILIRAEPVDWSKPEAKSLLASLVLSEDAQKFVIGKEILRVKSSEPLLTMSYPLASLLLVYGFAQNANTQLNGFARPLSFRVILYTLIGLFGAGMWAFMKDFTTVKYDVEGDKTLAEIGPSYVKGGHEYYVKVQQRNVALRQLLGKDGEKLYSATGNEEFLFRQKRLPISHSKFFFEEQLKNLGLA